MIKSADSPIKLVILDPGHFHAALMQKEHIAGVDETVEVFAPDGPDVYNYFSLIESYNTREKDATAWKMRNYIGADYLRQMLEHREGNLVILAGNNQRKSEYITGSINAKMDVLCDKPMVINERGYQGLKSAFLVAEKNGNLIYDIMTSRCEWYNAIISLLLQSSFLGELERGTNEHPAISLHSTHYFFKKVSGITLVRPSWYFDTTQQGTGIVDITTHLTDLVQWFSQPRQLIAERDVSILEAKQWPTFLPKEGYLEITRQNEVPSYLKPMLHNDTLSVYANGSFTYRLRDTVARVAVDWKYQPVNDETDTFTATIRCTRGIIHVSQDKEHNFKSALTITPLHQDINSFAKALQDFMSSFGGDYKDALISISGKMCEVVMQDALKLTHENQFARVVRQFLEYKETGRIPEWEKAFILTKYYTLQKALHIAQTTKDQ